MSRSTSESFLCDLRLDCFYQRGSLQKKEVDYIAEGIRDLFCLKDVFLISRQSRADSLEKYSGLRGSRVEAACESGQVVLTDEHQETFTCLIEAADSSTSNTVLHNEVVVVAHDQLVVDENFERRLMGFLKGLVQRLQPDFCYICDIGVSDHRYGRNRAGLANGLRDLYWVNVFGPPFIKLIGEEKLLSLSSYCEVERLAESEILVRFRGTNVSTMK